MLDRLSRLEEHVQAQEHNVPVSGKISQRIVLKKDEQIYSVLKDVIDPEVGIDIVNMGFVKEVLVDGAQCSSKPRVDNKSLPYGRISQRSG